MRSIIICLALAFFFFQHVTANAEERPNIIIFIADDVSWNDYGCYGNKAARTPHIDQLAADGIRFTNAYLTASSCSPSRSSIITGRYPHNNGKAAELHLPIDVRLPWFPEFLRAAGYYTALSGKNHMKSTKPEEGQSPRPKAFDLIDGGRAPDNKGGHANWVKILKERPREKPFFFWFAGYDAHRAWDGDEDWKLEYGPMHSPENVIVPPYLVDDAETRQDLASYYNEVTRFDDFIGQVVEQLRAEGTLDNTLIFVLADNGRPFPRAKTRLHDSGMKTALVAHWPEGTKHQNHDYEHLVSVIDLAPTILTAAGIELPETFQGLSLLPVFQSASPEPIRDYAFSEHNWHDYEAHGRSVRHESLLLIRNFRPDLPWQGPADSVRSPSHTALKQTRDAGQLTSAQADVFLAPRPEIELYDTATDPRQLKNLVADASYAAQKEHLLSTLQLWMEQTRDSVPENISADSFDRETGNRLKIKDYRGITPGEDAGAVMTNHPGPR